LGEATLPAVVVSKRPQERCKLPGRKTVKGGDSDLTQVVSAAPGVTVLEGARRELAAIDPALVLYEPQPLDEVVGRGRARERFALELIGAFAVLALALAGIGIYGVLSYAVTSRRAEIGIRMALGAPRAAVRGMILLRGVRLAAAGLACGAAGALALTRWLQSLVFEVSLSDPAVFARAAAVLAVAALAAAWLPARAATRVNPVETLAR
jgi:putative ABC transport system permease protein